MRLGDTVGRIALVIVVFAVGFTGRQVLTNDDIRPTSAVVAETSTAPASRGVIYDGGFPTYAAVVEVDTVSALSSPDTGAAVVATFDRASAKGIPTTFLVTGQQMEGNQPAWFQVLLPLRPNGSRAWVRADSVSIEGIEYEIRVHTRSFLLEVLHRGQRVQSIDIGTGTSATPTPAGLYYVNEVLKPPNKKTLYGTHVLGLSGFSEVVTDWPDGGHLAIHGTNDAANVIGERVSHGCIRMSNAHIDELARSIPLGTSVRITND